MIFVISVVLPCVAEAKLKLVVPVEQQDIERYRNFLAGQQAAVEEIRHLDSMHTNRVVAELVILQQALHAGGIPNELEFIETPNASRARMMVREGQAMISGHTFFSDAITADVYMSSAIIPKGTFAKGVYGLKRNAALMQVTTLEQLRHFTGISSKGWRVDWKTLEGLDLRELRNVPRFHMMFELVADRKADFALLEFPQRDDLVLHHEGIALHPVPGVLVALADSRHFTISQRHSMGPVLLEALEKGLAILRQQGLIKRYYQEVGFYNHRVADWKIINP